MDGFKILDDESLKTSTGKKLWPDGALDKKRSTVELSDDHNKHVKMELYFDGNQLKPKHFKRIKKHFGDDLNVLITIEL